MKACKKWWGKLLCSNNQNFRVIAESSWRAALEEVLGWLDCSIEHEEIKDKIHEELEDEN